jgi:hypothetical protein
LALATVFGVQLRPSQPTPRKKIVRGIHLQVMLHRAINSLILGLVASVAASIRAVHINRVRFQNVGGRTFVLKERHLFSWVLIIPGNFVFRWRQVPVQVLDTNQWKAWERAVVPLEHPPQEPNSRSLAIPEIDGIPLCQLLGDGNILAEQKLELVSLAARSLRKFHQREIDAPAHGSIRLSHGDATVRNVMISREMQTATWFDFDLRHDLRVKPNDRHADDLRALLFSAAHYFPDENLMTLVRVIKETYDQANVWEKLAQQAHGQWLNLDLFHLAHTRPIHEAGKKPVAGRISLDRNHAIAKAVGDNG